MAHPFGNDKALSRGKVDNAIFDIDQKTSVQNEKEFINVFVLMPMIVTLHHGQSHDRVVHLAKRLVVPLVRASIGQFLHVNQLKRSVENVEVSLVREFLGALSRIHAQI